MEWSLPTFSLYLSEENLHLDLLCNKSRNISSWILLGHPFSEEL